MKKDTIDAVVEAYSKAQASLATFQGSSPQNQEEEDAVTRMALQARFLRIHVVHMRQQTEGDAKDFLAACLVSNLMLDAIAATAYKARHSNPFGDISIDEIDRDIAEASFAFHLSACITVAESAANSVESIEKDITSGLPSMVSSSRGSYISLVASVKQLVSLWTSNLTLTDVLAQSWHVCAAKGDALATNRDLTIVIGGNVGTLGLDPHEFMTACGDTFSRYMQHQQQLKEAFSMLAVMFDVRDGS